MFCILFSKIYYSFYNFCFYNFVFCVNLFGNINHFIINIKMEFVSKFLEDDKTSICCLELFAIWKAF